MADLGREFKAFLLRGNVIDLAVAVVVGAAFGALVTALVRDLVTPLIAAVIGEPDFGALRFTVNGSTFAYGDFLNALFAFLSIAAAVFFLVVTPMNRLLARVRPQEPEAPLEPLRECPECLSEIPQRARRCRHCTAEVALG